MVGKRALGKGLGALLSDAITGTIQEIDINLIDPPLYQSRTVIDEKELEDLVTSIRAVGVIQPVVVEPVEGDRYRLLAGERRWRAARKAGLTTIPAYIRTAEENQRLEISLVENLIRKDLNPIEIALAYRRLIDEHDYTQEQLAQRLGKDRATIANYLRLLTLPQKVIEAVHQGKISVGHAKAILMLKDEHLQELLCEEIIKKDLSVRAAEQRAHQLAHSSSTSPPRPTLLPHLTRSLQSLSICEKAQAHLLPSGKVELKLRFPSEKHAREFIERLLQVSTR